MYALKVKEKNAQKEIDKLKSEGFFDITRKVVRGGGHVFIPISKRLPGSVEKEMPLKERLPSIRDKFGIGAFDIIGNIAVVWIPDELLPKKHEIAEHLVKLYPRVKAVYARQGAIGGNFRIPNLELLLGRGTSTVHTENGLRFKLDVKKAYFSPRQASEREKLVTYVDKGDVVAVFFAGIGPIPVYVSKFTEASEVYAIEHNPAACKYIEENLMLNGCKNVKVFCGDVKEEVKKIPRCDLVIMPLPKGSLDFLDEAQKSLKLGGRVIIYTSSTEEELDEKLDTVRKKFKIDDVRQELEIAPKEFRFVIHARRS